MSRIPRAFAALVAALATGLANAQAAAQGTATQSPAADPPAASAPSARQPAMLATSRPAATSVPKPVGRPMVCLVLSGGGARGAAHIGVIRVLEELRVPIDCITGTSMGSLVGGAYASGMTVAEMEKLTESITVDLLFRETPPRYDLTIRRKQDDVRLNLFSPEIGVSDKGEVSFAKGIVSGIQLETVLRDLSRIKGYVDFNKLPIPYRAIATDLVTGKPKVFDKGDLALAMRASMSVPGVIAPAEFDGMMLVDGGLVNNLPVDVAREMGADIVIAVNLGTPLMAREDIRNVLGITSQMIGILTEQNVRQSLASLESTDILILPELGNFSAGNFDNMKTTFPIGEAAARQVADRLAKLSLPPEQYARFQATRTQPIVASAEPIDAITFEPPPLKRVNPEFLATLIDTRTGEPIDQPKLDNDLLRLYGTRDFEHVNYQLIESPTRRILNIQGVEKSWGPNYLRFGLGLSSDFTGNAFFDLQGQYRRTWINSYGGEWLTNLVLGRNLGLYSEFYQPLEPRQRYFVSPYVDISRRFLSVFVDDNELAEYTVPYALGGVDFGTQFTRYGELRLGLYYGVARPSLNFGQDLLPGDEGTQHLAGVRLRGYFDQLDNLNFPRHGWAASFQLVKGLEALGSDNDYDQWEGSAVAARSWGRHSVNVALRGSGRITDNDRPIYIAQPWGGFLQQSGFQTGQLLNERYIYARVNYFYRLLDVPLFEGLYAGVAGEVGNYGRPLVDGNPTGTIYSGAAYLAFDSPLGPMYLGLGYGKGGSTAAYFYLGRP
jgi:NTE family protein